MICFRLRLNDEPAVTAGLPEISVLTTLVTYVPGRDELDVTLSGMRSRSASDHEHLKWLERPLRSGDRLTLEIVESDSPDAPPESRREEPEAWERDRRQYFEELKKEYEGE